MIGLCLFSLSTKYRRVTDSYLATAVRAMGSINLYNVYCNLRLYCVILIFCDAWHSNK